MSYPKPLQVDYWSLEELAACCATVAPEILGVSVFCADDVSLDVALDAPVARVRLAPLGSQRAVCEVWRSPLGPCRTGKSGPVRYRAGGTLVFGCVELCEASVAASDHPDAALPVIVELAYAEIFRCIEALGFPHLVRIWNHLPEINSDFGGQERYRLFNQARHRSFHACGRQVTGSVPAACALGSPAGTALVVYFLASTQACAVVENPRQVPAWNYPAQYGAFSPTFSRAVLTGVSDHPELFISGTASIVGHRSVHAGNAAEQAGEAAANVCALLRETNRVGKHVFAKEQLRYKVYVRHPGDYEAVASVLHEILRPAAAPVFLQADICRSDLLVEIEAVGLRQPEATHAAEE
jgi:chorismate lyase/3-hydroxybenzoate synthase